MITNVIYESNVVMEACNNRQLLNISCFFKESFKEYDCSWMVFSL